MEKIDAVSYTADPCLHTFYKRTPKYLFIILFLAVVIFGCTFYQRAVGQVEFGNYAHAILYLPLPKELFEKEDAFVLTEGTEYKKVFPKQSQIIDGSEYTFQLDKKYNSHFFNLTSATSKLLLWCNDKIQCVFEKTNKVNYESIKKTIIDGINIKKLFSKEELPKEFFEGGCDLSNESSCYIKPTKPITRLTDFYKAYWVADESKQTKADIVALIAKKSVEAQIDPITGLRIAFCESTYNPLAISKSSSAKGLFQFVDKTWQNYCTGDPLNAEDNINCFTKLYKLHPTWWVCKG